MIGLAAWRSFAMTNNLALTPQMGWNDWNSYHCGISETAVSNTANILVSTGMKTAGYQFVNIDDGWASSRDSNGVIQAYSISGKFPSGIKALSDYVHSKGLKLGIYTDHGTNTCSGCISTSINPVGKQPGSYGYEYIDAAAYAQMGADYLKNDSCNLPAGDVPMQDYLRMADGLMKSGQPIFNSLCPNAAHYEYWSPDAGNSWRTTGDIGSTFVSMIGRIDQNSKSAYVAGPGRWNDPDMLEIGNGEFATNLVAAQTHFTMWCIMAAPLIAGNNVTTMSAQTLAILTNAEAIAVDQDPAGEQGERVGGVVDSAEIWSKPLGYDFTARAVALLNRSTNTPATITCYWTNLALLPGSAIVRDLWSHQDLGTFVDSFTAVVPPYGSRLLRIVGTPIPPPAPGTNYLTDLPPIYAYTGYGTIMKNQSVGGHPITLGGVIYTNGIGTHAIGGNEYNLGGVCSRFHAVVGVDDEVGNSGSVIFQVIADGRKIYDSGILTGAAPPKTIDLDMTGVRRLIIGVTDTGNDVTGNRNSNDHSDWANAYVVVTNATPQMPYAPTGLIAGPGNPMTLTWNDTLAAVTYNVRRSSASGGPYTTIANVPITAFSDSNVLAGDTYYYVVSAVSSFGEGSNSVEASVTTCNVPLPPTNLVTTATNSEIILRWNASAGATSYDVIRFSSDTPPEVIASGVSATDYADTNIVLSQIYYYRVVAANTCNESAPSAFVADAVTDTGIVFSSSPVYWTNKITTSAQDWNLDANWTNASAFPNGAGSNAVINADIAAGQTINLNMPIVLGALSVGDPSGSGSFTINPNSGSLTLDNGANPAGITQLAGSKGDTIAAPITVTSNLAVTNNSASVLTFSGAVSGTGLFLSGGTLQVGDGTTHGAITFNSITNQGALLFRRGDNVSLGGAISGSGSLTQNGAGVLTLSGGNSFLGPVTVAHGTLKIGSSSALGATNGATTIQSGATLDVNGTSLGGEPVIVSGTGVNNEGAIYNSGSQITTGLRFVTMAGDTWLGGTGPWNPSNNQGRWDIRGTNNNVVSGVLSTTGQPYNLIKTGSNQVSIVAINVDPKLANIDIQQGLMGWETVTTSMGNPASNLTVRAGAVLSFYNAATPWDKHFILYGNGVSSTVTNWSGANVIIGPVQLNGDCLFWGGGTSLTLGNVVSGTGNLIKNGGYSLILSNANNYTGDTMVNAGTLSLVGNGAISASAEVNIAQGAILDASARSDSEFTVAGGQTLQGNGSIAGDLLVNPGGTIAPGGAPGTLTVSGAATLRGTTFLELNKTAHTNDSLNAASVSYGGTLALTNLAGTLAAGDGFKLFNAGSYGGQFTNIVPAIPGLNLAWITDGLSNGVLSVVSMPTPSPFVGINMDANGVVFSGSNGVPGWPYHLLTSTNASLPMSNWTVVMSNWFDGSGNFIFTNDPASNGPQRFFILQLP